MVQQGGGDWQRMPAAQPRGGNGDGYPQHSPEYYYFQYMRGRQGAQPQNPGQGNGWNPTPRPTFPAKNSGWYGSRSVDAPEAPELPAPQRASEEGPVEEVIEVDVEFEVEGEPTA